MGASFRLPFHLVMKRICSSRRFLSFPFRNEKASMRDVRIHPTRSLLASSWESASRTVRTWFHFVLAHRASRSLRAFSCARFRRRWEERTSATTRLGGSILSYARTFATRFQDSRQEHWRSRSTSRTSRSPSPRERQRKEGRTERIESCETQRKDAKSSKISPFEAFFRCFLNLRAVPRHVGAGDVGMATCEGRRRRCARKEGELARCLREAFQEDRGEEEEVPLQRSLRVPKTLYVSLSLRGQLQPSTSSAWDQESSRTWTGAQNASLGCETCVLLALAFLMSILDLTSGRTC